VAQLFEALRYRPEIRDFNSRWGDRNFSSAYFSWPHYDPEVDSASNRNENQGLFFFVAKGGKDGRCVGLTTLPPSHADCLENSGRLNFL
jgi:hypothetical protein